MYSFHEVNYTTRTLLGATFWWFCPACQININLRIYKCFVLTLCGYVYIYYIHEYLHAAYSHYIRRVYITCIVITLNIAYLHNMHRNYDPCSVFTLHAAHLQSMQRICITCSVFRLHVAYLHTMYTSLCKLYITMQNIIIYTTIYIMIRILLGVIQQSCAIGYSVHAEHCNSYNLACHLTRIYAPNQNIKLGKLAQLKLI